MDNCFYYGLTNTRQCITWGQGNAAVMHEPKVNALSTLPSCFILRNALPSHCMLSRAYCMAFAFFC